MNRASGFPKSLLIVYAVKKKIKQNKTEQDKLGREINVLLGAFLAFGSDNEIAYM